jgi:hypothetical protein
MDAGTQAPDAGVQPLPDEAAGGPTAGPVDPGVAPDVDSPTGGCSTGGGGTAAVAGGLLFAAWALGNARRKRARVYLTVRRK